MKTTYYANFRPMDDPEGHFATPVMTIFDRMDTDKRKLKAHVCAYATDFPFPYYPVVLEIINDDADMVVESFVQEEIGGAWKRRKGE